jgi:hypothetical protein
MGFGTRERVLKITDPQSQLDEKVLKMMLVSEMGTILYHIAINTIFKSRSHPETP